MSVEEVSRSEFYDGVNRRITQLSGEVAEIAEQIRDEPSAATYKLDEFGYYLQALRKLQQLRDKARAFDEHAEEDIVYLKKTGDHDGPKYYYLPRAEYDKSQLPSLIDQIESEGAADLSYIS